MREKVQDDLTLAGLVHDLNNIFETIQEAAEILSREDKARTIAAKIQRSVERGRRLVGAYVDQSRTSDLNVIVERAAGFILDFLGTLDGPQIKVTSKVESGIRLRGAPSDWERVFMNLFLNAAQAMREGGSIEVTARQESECLEIRVFDSGPGIPDAILADIFKPHFSTKTTKGCGLGLHIVASIVEQYGGSVAAANRKKTAGACFTIRLPEVAA